MTLVKVTITKDLLDLRQRVETAIARGMDRAVDRALSQLVRGSPDATGQLRRDWRAEKTRVDGGKFIAEITNGSVIYTIVGRGPGKMPPQAPIESWVRAVGLPVGLQFVIRKKIADEGTRRWQQANNFAGIKRDAPDGELDDSHVIPGGLLDRVKQDIEEQVQRELDRLR